MNDAGTDKEKERKKRSLRVSLVVSSLIVFFTVILALKIVVQISSVPGMDSGSNNDPRNIPVKVSAIPGFYCPIRMEMGRHEEVKFIISHRQLKGHKVRSIKAELKSREKGIFTVTSFSPAEKTPASATSDGWRWKVIPEKWGEHELTLILNISLENKGKVEILERKWNRRIDVNYNRNYWLYRWRWVLIGCGILIVAVLVDNILKTGRRFNRKEAKSAKGENGS